MATKARLHWFWRGMLGVAIGSACNMAILVVVLFRQMSSPQYNLTHDIIGYLACSVPGIVVYGLFTRDFGPVPPDGETHCRKCDHILRGLSEPRCPECGEAI